METFVPVTPTVYIRVEGGAARMRELHSKLNTEALEFQEEWQYIPHVTIVKMTSEPPAQTAFQMAHERWAKFSGSRRILLERLIFVREDLRADAPNCWVDLAPYGWDVRWFAINACCVYRRDHRLLLPFSYPAALAWP